MTNSNSQDISNSPSIQRFFFIFSKKNIDKQLKRILKREIILLISLNFGKRVCLFGLLIVNIT